jgi:acetylornithine/succinyldiaminopimelate/putrescine aminotransferase
MLERLATKYPELVEDVTGTGLLCAAHINPKYAVERHNGVEMIARRNGLGVIHGGKNALRFTPWFRTTDEEITLVEEVLEETFEQVLGGETHMPKA